MTRRSDPPARFETPARFKTPARSEPPAREITPFEVYLRRREFLGGTLAVGAAALAPNLACGSEVETPPSPGSGLPALQAKPSSLSTAEARTDREDATSYNNFYEFGTDKGDPARHAHGLRTRPWTLAVEGEVSKPGEIGIEDVLSGFELEERIYRLRCVEAWSMVIPWIGLPLSALLARFEPLSSARFVAFETLFDPEQMPGQRRGVLDWPYREGLRLDEAMHPLTILAVGMYGQVLPNQNGAPLRLVVPWKYGFKSIKSIVRIRLTREQPATSWNLSAPREYGFYSNVNPEVDHPRWSQKRERRIGEFRRRPTLPFNGYAEQVASLYKDMDLRKHY